MLPGALTGFENLQTNLIATDALHTDLGAVVQLETVTDFQHQGLIDLLHGQIRYPYRNFPQTLTHWFTRNFRKRPMAIICSSLQLSSQIHRWRSRHRELHGNIFEIDHSIQKPILVFDLFAREHRAIT